MMRWLSILRGFLLRFPMLLVAAALWVLSSRKHRRLVGLAVGAGLIGVVVLGELVLDHRHLPWRPLDIDERAGFATDLKLRVIDLGPSSWCDELLAESSMLSTRAVEARDEGDCGWPRAYHVEQSDGIVLTGKTVYPMRCALAAGAHIWMRSIDYHARNTLGSNLKRVHHAGTYSCRRMYNRQSGRMSEHAFAKAWDVTGFELEDGRVISVLDHWDERGARGKFLRAVHDDACRIFSVTLGPDYNEAHRDHFHVDVGGGLSCR